MQVLIILAIVVFLIWLAFKYWYVTLIVIVAGTVFYFINEGLKAQRLEEAAERERVRREKEAEAARTAEEEARRRRHRDEQNSFRQQMIALGAETLNVFEAAPRYLSLAETFLDRAEVDFAERAFAPFWDYIEKAATELGRFDEGLKQIQRNAAKYGELALKYESKTPAFPIARRSVDRLAVGSSSTTRLATVVRSAQRDFQFASIYEQRKTNQILVAGFGNLANALDRMSWQISESLGELAGSFDAMTATLDHSSGLIQSKVGELIERGTKQHGELMEQAADTAARETKALEMLDNIQHRRRLV